MKKIFYMFVFLIAVIALPVIASAQETTPNSKFVEIQNRLENRKSNESAEDILKEFIGNEESSAPENNLAQKSHTRVIFPAESQKDLATCLYEPFNVTFLCDTKWESLEDTNLVIYRVSSSPAVSLTITKVSDTFKYLEQINKSDLILTEQYADNFVLQDTVIKGQKVKQVSGFAKASPNIRYLDYYMVNNGSLYSVLFAVDPKESWDNYKFLVKTIADSVEFK